jgi:hypothetical protein
MDLLNQQSMQRNPLDAMMQPPVGAMQTKGRAGQYMPPERIEGVREAFGGGRPQRSRGRGKFQGAFMYEGRTVNVDNRNRFYVQGKDGNEYIFKTEQEAKDFIDAGK